MQGVQCNRVQSGCAASGIQGLYGRETHACDLHSRYDRCKPRRLPRWIVRQASAPPRLRAILIFVFFCYCCGHAKTESQSTSAASWAALNVHLIQPTNHTSHYATSVHTLDRLPMLQLQIFAVLHVMLTNWAPPQPTEPSASILRRGFPHRYHPSSTRSTSGNCNGVLYRYLVALTRRFRENSA